MIETTEGPFLVLTGEKYDRDRLIRDIPALVREDIKDAIADGTLPDGLKVTVQKREYPHGFGIVITVRELPWKPAYKSSIAAKNANIELHQQLRSKLQAYQRIEQYADPSDDYWKANFTAVVTWQLGQ